MTYAKQVVEYQSSCPSALILPDDPDNERVRFVPGKAGSACALPCKYVRSISAEISAVFSSIFLFYIGALCGPRSNGMFSEELSRLLQQ
jgi:hypothetical protein